MDNLLLDAENLFLTSDIVDNYCAKQREIINVYYAQIMALENEWQDDKTFGSVVEEIKRLRTQLLAVIEEIKMTYPKYFREKARQIIERPTFNNSDSTPIKVIEEVRVPSFNSDYHRDYSRGAYGNGYYSGGDFPLRISGHPNNVSSSPSINYSPLHRTDNSYIKSAFAVEGNTPKLNNILQSSFANAPQYLMESVYKTTNKLEFVNSQKGCYYAPCGINSHVHKSIIGVDFDSPNLSGEIVSLVGQHVFYYACDKDYYDITEALREECGNLTMKDGLRCQEYLDVFREGVSIPEGQNDVRLLKKAYKTAARFFVEVFVANVNQDEKIKAELKELFPKSYSIAMRILENQEDELILGEE